MTTLDDLLPLDEFDPRTAQILLGDNPSFRESQTELVALVKQRIHEAGDPTMIARLPELDEAYEAYRADPVWVGPAYARLLDILRPLLEFLGVGSLASSGVENSLSQFLRLQPGRKLFEAYKVGRSFESRHRVHKTEILQPLAAGCVVPTVGCLYERFIPRLRGY
jgi:hypothetical protein